MDDIERFHYARHQLQAAEVVAMCDRFGYGFVMTEAANEWAKRDPIGAFTIGPCLGLIKKETDYMPASLSCIVCAKTLTNIGDDINQPDGGIAFASPGHYGTTVFDPMDGSTLEINICDPCVKSAAEAGRILYHDKKRDSGLTIWDGKTG